MTPILSALFANPPLDSRIYVVDPIRTVALFDEVKSPEGQALLKENHAKVTACPAGGRIEDAFYGVLPLSNAQVACHYAPLGAVPDEARAGQDPLWCLAYYARHQSGVIVLYLDCKDAWLEHSVAVAEMLRRESENHIIVLLHGTTQEAVDETLRTLGLSKPRNRAC